MFLGLGLSLQSTRGISVPRLGIAAEEAPDTAAFSGAAIAPPVSGALAGTEARDQAAFSGAAAPPGVAGAFGAAESPDSASLTGDAATAARAFTKVFTDLSGWTEVAFPASLSYALTPTTGNVPITNGRAYFDIQGKVFDFPALIRQMPELVDGVVYTITARFANNSAPGGVSLRAMMDPAINNSTLAGGLSLSTGSSGAATITVAWVAGAYLRITLEAEGGGNGHANLLSLIVDGPAALWADKRPIAQHYGAEFTSRSATNPGGVDMDSALALSNATALQARLDAQAATIISNTATFNAQGVIVWDLFWQEFGHPTTYLGAPEMIPVLSSALDAQLNRFFSQLKTAGLRVGTTLRPQYVPYGTSLPPLSDIHNAAAYSQLEPFIVTSQSFGHRLWVKYYADWGDGDAPHWVWADWDPVHPTEGPGQMNIDPGQESTVITRLVDRIQYCKDRWGMELFYVDSTVYRDGTSLPAAVFADVQMAHPDVLIMPENEAAGYWSVSVPYNQLNIGETGVPSGTSGVAALSFAGLTQSQWNSLRTYLRAEYVAGRLIPLVEHYDTTTRPWVIETVTGVPAGISGALSGAEAPDTAAFSGSASAPSVPGTLSGTERPDTAAFSGSATPPAVSGALSGAESADVAAFSGTGVIVWDAAAQNPSGSYTLSGDRLTATRVNSGTADIFGSAPKGPGLKFFEVVIGAFTGEVAVGLATPAFFAAASGEQWLGHYSHSLGLYDNGKALYGYFDGPANRFEAAIDPTRSFVTGDRVRVSYDDTTVAFYVNGSLVFSHACNMAALYGAENVYPAFYSTDSGASVVGDFLGWRAVSSGDPPVPPTLFTQTAATGMTTQFTLPAMTDPEGGPVTYTSTSSPSGPLPGFVSFNSSTRTYTVNPTGSDVGGYTIRYTGTDQQGLSTSLDFTLTVSLAAVSGALGATGAPDTAAFAGAAAAPGVSGALAATGSPDTAAMSGAASPPAVSGISAAGDSRTESADGTTSNPWPTQFAAMTAMSAFNHGHSGQGLTYLSSVYASEVDPDYNASTCNTAVCFGGINDIILQGADAATVRSRMQSWVALAKARYPRVGVATIPVPAVGALATVTSGMVAACEAFNAALRADYSFADLLIDLAADPRLAAPPSTAPTAVYYDGLHFTSYGAGIVAEITAEALGVTYVSIPTLVWQTGPALAITTSESVGAGWTVYVQVDDSSGFGSPAINTSYTFTGSEDLNSELTGLITGLGDGTWYAHTRLGDGSGRTSPWSAGAGPRTVDRVPTFTGSFTDQTSVALSTPVTSATTITISGLSDPILFAVTGSGTVTKNGGSGLTSGTVTNGDVIGAGHTSSGSNNTTVNTVFTAGGVSDTFSSTTVAVTSSTAWNTTPDIGTATYSNSNRQLVYTAGELTVHTTTAITGKKVFALTLDDTINYSSYGVFSPNATPSFGLGRDATSTGVAWFSNGTSNLPGGSGPGSAFFSTGVTLAIAVDKPNGKIWITNDGTNWYGDTGTPVNLASMESGSGSAAIGSAASDPAGLYGAVGKAFGTSGGQVTLLTSYPFNSGTLPSGFSYL